MLYVCVYKNIYNIYNICNMYNIYKYICNHGNNVPSRFVEKMHQKKANAEALCKIWFVPFAP